VRAPKEVSLYQQKDGKWIFRARTSGGSVFISGRTPDAVKGRAYEAYQILLKILFEIDSLQKESSS